MNDNTDKIATVLYFLKAAKFDNIYYGGHSSQEAWEAVSQLLFNKTGDELESLLDAAYQKEWERVKNES